MLFPGERPNVVIPTPSIRITRSLRVSAALSVIGLLLGRYVISGIAVQSCVMYGRSDDLTSSDSTHLFITSDCMLKCEAAARSFKQNGIRDPTSRTILDGGASRDFCAVSDMEKYCIPGTITKLPVAMPVKMGTTWSVATLKGEQAEFHVSAFDKSCLRRYR